MVSVCLPSDVSLNIYGLTWVSPTLDVGYLFTTTPAKYRHWSFTLDEGYLLTLPLLTLNVE